MLMVRPSDSTYDVFVVIGIYKGYDGDAYLKTMNALIDTMLG